MSEVAPAQLDAALSATIREGLAQRLGNLRAAKLR